MSQNHPHWSAMKERGSTLGIQFLMLVYKVLGKRVFQICFCPVMIYFYLTGGLSRQAVNQYWHQVEVTRAETPSGFWRRHWRGFRSFYSFGLSIVDKFDAWLGKIGLDDLDIMTPDGYQGLTSSQGAVVLSSHIGNMEICRAIFGAGQHKKPLNVITYNEHAPTFNNFLKKINPEAAINFIHINNFGPDDTIKLKQKIDDGEVVVIFADRTSVNNPDSVQYVPFLSKPAPIATGPFALATIMECPVYLMLCLKDTSSGRHQVYIEHFADPVKVKRKQRQAYFLSLMEKYADRLSYYCLKSPYQWYNFFDFWRDYNKTQAQDESMKTQHKVGVD